LLCTWIPEATLVPVAKGPLATPGAKGSLIAAAGAFPAEDQFSVPIREKEVAAAVNAGSVVWNSTPAKPVPAEKCSAMSATKERARRRVRAENNGRRLL
jgi:hypothetical protein